MHPDNLNVFDLDETLIRVNSFKEISRKLVFMLLRKRKVIPLLGITVWFLARKLRFVKHLRFKQRVVGTFEKELTEDEKGDIVKTVFEANINKDVYERMLNADSCVISTAAPFAFVSRMPLEKNAVVISSLDHRNNFPDLSNIGLGKVENLKYYFQGKNVRVSNFYTDSENDRELIDFSAHAFVVEDGRLTKLK